MKIILNTPVSGVLNSFTKSSKTHQIASMGFDGKKLDFQGSRIESGLFDQIGGSSIDAYLIHVPSPYSKKAVDFIKKKTPYVPIVIFGKTEDIMEITGADIYLPFYPNEDEDLLTSQCEKFLHISLWNIINYLKNFDKLKKLTTKMSDVIEFNNCKYDPTRRTLFYKGKEVKKLSAKEGGIVEILASNFGEVVKKEIILEKVWHKSDYFSGRSMDVYVTHLRNLLKESDIDVNIKNISGVGLILE
jgi:DNA-binding winged helix-turn-helix (wHTH) protein